MPKVSKQDAVEHSRNGVYGRYYQMPEINGGTTVAYAEFRGEHGQRTIGEKSRIYYILDGAAEFEINGEKFPAQGQSVARITMPIIAAHNLAETIIQTERMHAKRREGKKND